MQLSEMARLCDGEQISSDRIGAIRLDLPCCEGRTLLGCAADRGDIDQIKKLIVLGADPDCIDLLGQPALVVATLNNKVESVRALLENGADPDTTDSNGRSSLMYSLYSGYLEISELLKSFDASAVLRDLDGRTVADYAIHQTSDKDTKSTAEFVQGLGIESTTAKAKLSPMRSDPDFVTLEYIKRQNFFKLLKLSFFICLWLFVLGMIYIETSLIYILSNFYPLSLVIDLLLNSFPLLLLVVWPILKLRRSAQQTSAEQSENFSIESDFQNIAPHDGVARVVSNIIKHGGRRAFEGFKSKPLSHGREKKLIWSSLALVLLLPFFLGVFNSVMLQISYEWLLVLDWFLWIPINTILLCAMLFGVRAVAAFAFSEALMAKQKERNRFMSERLENMSESKKPLENYVLYLRSFLQDGAVQVGNFDLETVLAYSLSQFTDVVSLSEETERLGPLGFESNDLEWEERVLELARGARLIILIPAATPGVVREAEMLKANDLLSKCIFVAPPEKGLSSEDSQAERWQSMLDFGVFATLEIPEYLASGFLFRLSNNGRLESWDALGLQLEPPPIVAGGDLNNDYDSDSSSDADMSFNDGMDWTVLDTSAIDQTHSNDIYNDYHHDFHDDNHHL